MAELHSRHIGLKSVTNFRDIGGYRTQNGNSVAWRRVFRSGEFGHLTRNDFQRLTEEIGLTSVIDLRSTLEIERQGIGLLSESDIRYHSVPFFTGSDRAEDEQLFRKLTNMGEFYVHLVRYKDFGKRIIEALEVIAEPENHPLVFNCAVGKDRTGILASILLSILGVGDEDIIEDYSLSGPYMEELLKQINSNPKMAEAIKPLPGYFWKAAPESMTLFLSTLRKEYGSTKGYLESLGMEPSLVGRLERALLT
jgi:protein-tyrosine phosphatase